jgi:hypothetical protein
VRCIVRCAISLQRRTALCVLTLEVHHNIVCLEHGVTCHSDVHSHGGSTVQSCLKVWYCVKFVMNTHLLLGDSVVTGF